MDPIFVALFVLWLTDIAWETCLMTAVNGIVQAGPSLIAGALPLVLTAANPAMAIAPAIASLTGGMAKPGKTNGHKERSDTDAKAPIINPKPAQTLPVSNDPAYVAAGLVSAFFTTFYSYLTSGADGGIDWKKFDDSSAVSGTVTAEKTRTKGLTWLITNLALQRDNVDFTTEQPSIELKKAFEDAIAVSTGQIDFFVAFVD